MRKQAKKWCGRCKATGIELVVNSTRKCKTVVCRGKTKCESGYHKFYYCKPCKTVASERYNKSEKGRAAVKRYIDSENGKAVARLYRESERGKAAKKKYDESEKGRTASRKAVKKYLTSNKEKREAWDLVAKAKMPKEPCAKCGAFGRIHRHHANYEKPLEVTPLCTPCHSAEHKRIKEEKIKKEGIKKAVTREEHLAKRIAWNLEHEAGAKAEYEKEQLQIKAEYEKEQRQAAL